MLSICTRQLGMFSNEEICLSAMRIAELQSVEPATVDVEAWFTNSEKVIRRTKFFRC